MCSSLATGSRPAADQHCSYRGLPPREPAMSITPAVTLLLYPPAMSQQNINDLLVIWLVPQEQSTS